MPTKQKLRSMIIAPRGKTLIACDLSQAETWIVAWLANEYNMKDFLLRGVIHEATAAEIFGKAIEDVIVEERYIGKQNNHANAYGMKAAQQARVINKRSDQPPYVVVTIKQCKKYQETWHSLFPGVHMWHDETKAQLNRNMTLITPYGRSRTFFGNWGDELFKQAYAHVPQSTVSDHFHGCVQPELGIEGGLIKVCAALLTDEVLLCHDAHDSCMLEVPEKNALEIGEQLRGILRRPLVVNGEEITIPVDLEMGDRWGEMEKVKM